MEADAPAPNRPPVSLSLLAGFPEAISREAQDILDAEGTGLFVERRAPKPYAGLELYLPTAAVLFVTAGFFNGFLKKAGEDSYDALKRAALSLWKRLRSAPITVVATPGKVSPDPKYSLAYSIVGQYAPGLNFKLVVKTQIGPEEAEAGIAAFFQLIDDLINDRVSEADCAALLTYMPMAGTVLVTYDAATMRIVPVDAMEGVREGE